MIPSNLIAYQDAMVVGKLIATVTDSGIVLTGRVRKRRDNEFRATACLLLRQLADGVAEEEVSGFAVDVFDRTLTQGSLGESGHARFFPAHTGDPSLRTRTLLVTVADRIGKRWPYQPDPSTP